MKADKWGKEQRIERQRGGNRRQEIEEEGKKGIYEVRKDRKARKRRQKEREKKKEKRR
jgi:hypothetical protein